MDQMQPHRAEQPGGTVVVIARRRRTGRTASAGVDGTNVRIVGTEAVLHLVGNGDAHRVESRFQGVGKVEAVGWIPSDAGRHVVGFDRRDFVDFS